MNRSKLIRVSALLVVLALAGTGVFFASRKHEAPQRAFYFWKTVWASSPEIESALTKNGINRLYMRFFDVRWDKGSKEARPISPIRFATPVPKIEIVPVVYLVNAVFLKIEYKDVEALADHVWAEVDGLAKSQNIQVKQIQLDCDWSDDSRRNYFHFADLMSRRLAKQGIIVSSTIRLHQIKYVARTGIPPVSRGMLMFYNFGTIKADSDRSSIFNEKDASRYSSYISSYKFPLDIVLPLFSWVVHSRDGRVLGLLEKLDPKELTDANGFEKKGENRFVSKNSFFFQGRYFMAGDLLLVEETTPAVTQQAADLALKGAGWSKTYQTVALFDLDERNLNRYAKSEIKGILAQF